MSIDRSPLFHARRCFLRHSTAVLSVGGLLALADSATPAFAKKKKSMSANAQDAELLNAAIGLEHEGIAAYQIAAESKLMMPGTLAVGIQFQGHHKQHLDELAKAVKRLGGKPVGPKTQAEYATAIGASTLKTEADVLKLALKLERGATNAYLGLISSLAGSDLDVLVARLATDEAVHVAVLMSATGEKLSDQGLFFG
jgi:rubrerythrin